MGLQLPRQLDGCSAIERLTANLPARVLLQQGLEPAPDDIMIIGQQYLDHESLSRPGERTPIGGILPGYQRLRDTAVPVPQTGVLL